MFFIKKKLIQSSTITTNITMFFIKKKKWFNLQPKMIQSSTITTNITLCSSSKKKKKKKKKKKISNIPPYSKLYKNKEERSEVVTTPGTRNIIEYITEI